jgi:hypothetical protein
MINPIGMFMCGCCSRKFPGNESAFRRGQSRGEETMRKIKARWRGREIHVFAIVCLCRRIFLVLRSFSGGNGN